MRTFYEFTSERVTNQPCVFTFGTFDGVHLGHQKLFHEVTSYARTHTLLSAVFTFTNHPLSLLSPEKAPFLLTTAEEKHALIEAAGFDISIELPFTHALACLSADEFIQKLSTMLPIALFIVGEDVVYAKGREGNRAHLEKKGLEIGFRVQFLPKFLFDGQPISSSRIRQLITERKFHEASQLLGRPSSSLSIDI